ncbi:MAG TPA: mechanosensitive ion channel [Kiritimatiellia bacterium]|nr:mechanosensitive ion channel [Kiritimatiellia bacterium]
MKPLVRRLARGVLALGLFAAPAAAQSEPQAAPGISISGLDTVKSLEALQRALLIKEQALAVQQERLAAETDPLAREELLKGAASLREEVEESRRQFDQFAVDIDLQPFSPERAPAKFDWQEKIGQLLQPIMAEVENATRETRLIGSLRSQLEDVRKRRDLAERAVVNLDQLLAEPASPELKSRLEQRRSIWSQTLDQAGNEFMALEIQLQSRLASRESVLDQSTKFFRTIFKTRGLNLTLGIGAFCVVFFGFRLAEYVVHRARRGADKKSFSSRLTALLFHVFSILGGLLAMMAVFNLVGDWFMLGLIVIFLLGVAWASINTLPQQIETIKLMLNVGAVREGEVLVYDGTPYKVDALALSAKLVNPLLDGGRRELPVKYLVGMTSRPPGAREAWFPCREGDWVELADGKTGRIASQTPSAVTLIEWGGARVVYPTKSFLELNPRNLSEGSRVEMTFGIDYKHQSQATTEIPRLMEEKLKDGLSRVVDAQHLLRVAVDFSAAGSSSLDLTVSVDLAGAAAERIREVRFAIQRILVDMCTAHGWVIPFRQLTVHQAT